jgi:hypothetical protein
MIYLILRLKNRVKERGEKGLLRIQRESKGIKRKIPEAKGRVEIRFELFQDRFINNVVIIPKEIRFAKI